MHQPYSVRPSAGQLERDRDLALEHLAGAFDDAHNDGIGSEAVAHAAIFAALATLISEFGEEPVAAIMAALPMRIVSGEFSLDKTIQ